MSAVRSSNTLSSTVQGAGVGVGIGIGTGRIMGYSCHRCKCTKDNDQLVQCTSRAKSGRGRECKKKFCLSCLNRIGVANSNDNSVVTGYHPQSTWICPACLSLCGCAMCKRKKVCDASTQGRAVPVSAPTQAHALESTTHIVRTMSAAEYLNRNSNKYRIQ